MFPHVIFLCGRSWKLSPVRTITLNTFESCGEEAIRPLCQFLVSCETHSLEAITQKDLVFIEDGNEDFRANGMINFQKMQLLGQYIIQIRHCQSTPYRFTTIPLLQKYLQEETFNLDPEQIAQMARRCEPSKETPEKRTHK